MFQFRDITHVSQVTWKRGQEVLDCFPVKFHRESPVLFTHYSHSALDTRVYTNHDLREVG